MRTVKILAVFLSIIACGYVVEAADAKVKKVLPQFLDLRGKSSLSPSLYERDAYQFFLRNNPDQRSGIRFNVQWKGSTKGKNLVLRVQMRGVRGDTSRVEHLEVPATKTGWFSTWSALTLDGEPYKTFGDLSAWRTTLWDGETLLAEKKSFLW